MFYFDYFKVVYVGGQNLNPKYQLNFHRETRSLRTAYGLIISLHRGWCPNVSKLYKTEPTLANNDYENKIEWPYKTRMEPGKTEYKSEITMIQKCKYFSFFPYGIRIIYQGVQVLIRQWSFLSDKKILVIARHSLVTAPTQNPEKSNWGFYRNILRDRFSGPGSTGAPL